MTSNESSRREQPSRVETGSEVANPVLDETASLTRRRALQRAAVAASITAAPLVVDSMFLPAAADTNDFPMNLTNPGSYTAEVPCRKQVHFVMSGGGGGAGSGNNWGSNGGSNGGLRICRG